MKPMMVLLYAAALLAGLGPQPAYSLTSFEATSLVTDASDAQLVNPWGISSSATSPFWVSDNGSGRVTLYKVDPVSNATTKQGLEVAIPGDGSVTGQAFNDASGSLQFNGDAFLFASEDGTISGWRPALGSSAETIQLASIDNVYKGAAFATIGSNAYLYAANFKQGKIDVLGGGQLTPALMGDFTDPNLPSGYAPFNIVHLGSSLFVSYAVVGQSGDDVPGAGHGIVDEFSLQGSLIRRMAAGGALDSPWGIAVAPASFGSYAGDLLVGNSGDGTINAYDFLSASYVGQLKDGNGNPISIEGLWGLAPGNDVSGGSSQSIYFTAGPGAEAHGVFGVIQPIPEPSTALLVGLGLLILGRCRGRSARVD